MTTYLVCGAFLSVIACIIFLGIGYNMGVKAGYKVACLMASIMMTVSTEKEKEDGNSSK